jgi:ATP-binding cassette subfamily B multidrug efflux pump
MMSVNVRLAIYSILPHAYFGLQYLLCKQHYQFTAASRIQQRLSSLSSFVQENFSGIRVIKSYVREKFVQNRFAGESEGLQNTIHVVGTGAGFVLPLNAVIDWY